MCNCVSVINTKMEAKGLNTVIDVPYQMTKDLGEAPQRTKVVTAKKCRSVRKRPVDVFASFCPFCGEKY